MPQGHTPLGVIHFWGPLRGALFSACPGRRHDVPDVKDRLDQSGSYRGWRERIVEPRKCVISEYGSPIKVKNQQGSDLIELRLTWREMENFIFVRFIRVFGEILEDFWRTFEEFWRNWFVEEKIKNFRKVENEPFWWPQRPLQPPNSLRGQI